jgi:glycosyltransferase involved in cell wall biosynthesis
MMTRLSNNNRVLFVDPPVAYSNIFISPSLFKNHWEKTVLWMKGVRQARKNIYVYYPPPLFLQYGHLDIMDRLNQSITANAVARVVGRLEFTTPIIWIYHPYAVFPNGQFKEKLVCYDCNDDVGFFYTQNFRNKRKVLSFMEEKLTKRADIVFATSKNLYTLRHSQNPNTYYFPSGIDFDSFQKDRSSSPSIPDDLKNIQGPIIGFVGGMDNTKMNWEWIQKASMGKADWSFVFIGPCVAPLPDEIKHQKNIFFLGTKETAFLPEYLKAFDVCIIPYRGHDFLRNCFPTKVFEYLAAGKPVVSSVIPALEEFQHVVRLSGNQEEFISNIENALIEGREERFIRNCIEIAQDRTWENRVEKTSERIKSLLNLQCNQIV